MAIRKPTVALDFDGVLHTYSRGWEDGTIYDVPVEGSVEAINILRMYFDFVIFTCRRPLDDVEDWVKKYYGFFIPATNAKPVADMYIDDRGYRFEGDWKLAAIDIMRLWNEHWSRAADAAHQKG